MKRFCTLVALMVLSSSADAGESFSFTVGGHRVHVEAPRHCRSVSCVLVSIPGIYEARRKRDPDDDVDVAPHALPAKSAAPALAPVSIRPAVPPASKPPVEPAAAPPAPPALKLAGCATQDVAAPQPPAVQPLIATPPLAPPPIVTTRPAPDAPPKLSRVSHETEDAPVATPLGDWQTEGKKGSVRIEQCGRALCGYVLDPASNAVGETVLINMKPKASSEWSGNIYSRESKNTYYATIAMKGPNSLRVEACALGQFFCSGNLWSRTGATPERLITSRQISPELRS
jgi:Uncharacterized protein conserved in bacteria (DUF2147)